MVARTGRFRRWCFTTFDEELIRDCRNNGTNLQSKLSEGIYGSWQIEKCPKSGREHIQGYVRFGTPKSLAQLRGLFEGHFENAKGSEKDNISYTQKVESRVAGPWSFGSPSSQGKRKDIDAARETVQETGKMRCVVDEAGLQGIRVAACWLTHNEEPRTWKPHVQWFHGASGSGKTRAAHELLDSYEGDKWVSFIDLKWFEGYDAHENVLFDDFRCKSCKFEFLLNLLDRYECKVEVKGGSRQFKPCNIIITCIYSPTELYKHRIDESIKQLTRRIDVIKLFGEEQFRSCAASAPGFKN